MTSPVMLARYTLPLHAARVAARSSTCRRLPVVDSDDNLVGIVTRSDLLRVFLRDDEAVREPCDLLHQTTAIHRHVDDRSGCSPWGRHAGQLDSRVMFEPLVDVIGDMTASSPYTTTSAHRLTAPSVGCPKYVHAPAAPTRTPAALSSSSVIDSSLAGISSGMLRAPFSHRSSLVQRGRLRGLRWGCRSRRWGRGLR